MQREEVYWNVIDSVEVGQNPTDCAEFLACIPKFRMNNLQSEFLNRYKEYNWRKATFVADPYDTESALLNSTILNEYKKV